MVTKSFAPNPPSSPCLDGTHCAACCRGVLSLVRDSISAATGVLVLVLVVLTVATAGDRVAGFLAAVSAGAWFDFFFTEPYLTFAINDPDESRPPSCCW